MNEKGRSTAELRPEKLKQVPGAHANRTNTQLVVSLAAAHDLTHADTHFERRVA